MPEQRKLLLKRRLCVHHSKEPALTRVIDHDVRRERTIARGDADQTGILNQVINLGGRGIEADEFFNDLPVGPTEVGLSLDGRGTKPCTPEQVVE